MPFDPRPFDPRLVHPDEPPLRADGELELPADLAALAEQLADDAAHLAARYPASRAAVLAEPIEDGTQPRRSLAWLATIAGSGLTCLAALGMTVSLAWRPPQPAPAAPGIARATHQWVEHREAFPPAIPANPTGLSAAVSVGELSVGELSGPELEALLDLLQQEPRSVASISF